MYLYEGETSGVIGSNGYFTYLYSTWSSTAIPLNLTKNMMNKIIHLHNKHTPTIMITEN